MPDEESSGGGSTTGQTVSRTSQRVFIIAMAAAIVAVVGVVAVGLISGGGGAADPAVAVVSVEGQITGDTAENLETELRDLRDNNNVEAVVLKMDTPGGLVQPTERMYTAVKQMSEEMPVVASVQAISASGGYWTMLPADRVYVSATSIVGSVGVNAPAPSPAAPVEGPTGPDKAGSTITGRWATIDTLQRLFVTSVFEERGDTIDLSREEVATASVWRGIEAVENGLADEIGLLDAAIQDAAARAGLDEYRIIERNTAPQGLFLLFSAEAGGLVTVEGEDPALNDVAPVEMSVIYQPWVPDIENAQSVIAASSPSAAGARDAAAINETTAEPDAGTGTGADTDTDGDR